jgi:hypothetical protein
MEQGGIRITVFLLLGVAGLTALSSLVGSGDPAEAVASEEAIEDSDDMNLSTTAAERSMDARPAPSAPRHEMEPSALEEFLGADHTLTLPAPRPEQQEWSWEDDSVQLAFEGCKPVARDPLVPKVTLSVRAPVDFDALGAIEQHFGFDPKDVFTIESNTDEEVEYSLTSHLGDEVVAVLAKRGILVEDSAIRADFPWLVRQTAPHLRPLAQAVVEEWARSMPKPRESKTPRPGNIMRSDTMLEALTSFVQRAVPYESIPARLQEFERCGVRTPGPTLKRGADCDSKALLLAAMIRSVNDRMPIVLVSLTVTGRPHMLIGVGVPARDCDAILDYRGRRYVLVEVTSALGVGVMAPDYNDAVLEHYTIIP